VVPTGATFFLFNYLVFRYLWIEISNSKWQKPNTIAKNFKFETATHHFCGGQYPKGTRCRIFINPE